MKQMGNETFVALNVKLEQLHSAATDLRFTLLALESGTAKP